MSSWLNRNSRNIRSSKPYIVSEQKLTFNTTPNIINDNVSNNITNKTTIFELNKKNDLLNIHLDEKTKQIINVSYSFNLEYYKMFNPELTNLSDNALYNHFIYFGKKANSKFCDYDCKFNDNFIPNNINEELHNAIYTHINFRRIKTYSELIEYRNLFKKEFYIYNESSFYIYYPDFDTNFYKNTYLSGNEQLSTFDIHYHFYKNKNNLINNKQLIIMYTPPLDIKCGGITVMHYLCKLINDNYSDKYIAKLFMHNNIRYYNYFCNSFANLDEINDKTVVIYPEIVTGNPLNAKNVVRWILLNLGNEMPFDHYKTWNPTDLVYFWETNMQNVKRLVYPFKNPLFSMKNIKKTKTCYLYKKRDLFHKNIQLMHPNDSICIDNLSISEINNIFNECNIFYSYDPHSFYIIYAAMCGCIAVVHPKPNISEKEYFDSIILNFEGSHYRKGILYGYDPDKILEAQKEINECENYYNNFFKLFDIYIQNFLNDIDIYSKDKLSLTNTVQNTFI